MPRQQQQAQTEREPEQRRSNGTGRIDWGAYRLNTTHSMSRRVCEALHWAATRYPGSFVDHRVLAKVVYGFSSRTSALDIERVRGAISNANRLLLSMYNREIIVERDVGVRASIDDYDKAKHVLTRRRNRVESSVRTFKQTAESIDPNKIPNTPDKRGVREFAMRSTKELLPLLRSEMWQQRLLPPAEPDADGKRR